MTGYIVEMSSWPITTDSEPPEPTDWTIVTSKCHSTSYIMRNLAEDREYIFRVRAQNIHGPSAPGKVCEPVSFSKADTDFDDADEDTDDGDDDEFDSGFEHRQVTLQDGHIFKDKFDIYEELGRGRFGWSSKCATRTRARFSQRSLFDVASRRRERSARRRSTS